jgi:hypothetical protein
LERNSAPTIAEVGIDRALGGRSKFPQYFQNLRQLNAKARAAIQAPVTRRAFRKVSIAPGRLAAARAVGDTVLAYDGNAT